MPSSDGSNTEPTVTSSFLRSCLKLTLWYGTAILGTTAALAEQISSTAFPELEDSWSPSTATRRSTDPDLSGAPELDRPYAVAEDGPWYVMHSSNLRSLLQRVADGADPEWVLADFEIESHLHNDEGDHPSLVDEELTDQLTPPEEGP